MSPRVSARADYGREIRVRALCLMEAHGRAAETIVREAAAEAGLPASERNFLDAVAARLARLSAQSRCLGSSA